MSFYQQLGGSGSGSEIFISRLRIIFAVFKVITVFFKRHNFKVSFPNCLSKKKKIELDRSRFIFNPVRAQINHRGGRNVRRAAGILDPKTIRKLAERGSTSEEDIDVFDQVHLPKRKYYEWAILKPENKSDELLAKLVAIKQVHINMPYSEASITLARELIKLEHPNVAKFHGIVKDAIPGSALRVWDYYNKGRAFHYSKIRMPEALKSF